MEANALTLSNSDKEVEQLCFSIRQSLKASLDRHATFTHLVGLYNISLEYINNMDLMLQARRMDNENELNYKAPLNTAICDYYDIEKSVATLIYQYKSA